MNQASYPFSSIYKVTMDCAERTLSLALQGGESLFKCYIGVTREFLGDAEKQLIRLPSGGTPSFDPGDWLALFQANTERAMELTRTCAEAATRTQGELLRVSQQEMEVFGKMWRENIQGVTKVAEAASGGGIEPFAPRHRKAA